MTLAPAEIERYQRKAHAVIDAWGSLFGASPTMRALVRVMCVAEFETHLGDARGWEGEHNWGAITKRTLSPIERSTLAEHGISAEGGDAAMVAARALLPAAANEALHIDRSPGKGHHFAWFWAFPSDASAARKFLQVLLMQRPSVRSVLEHDDIAEMARAMYETHYFEGDSVNDADANVRAYARRIGELEPVIAAALSSPVCTRCAASPPERSPGSPAPAPPPVAYPPRYASRSGTAGMHVFLGAIVLLFGSILARGAHR